jgi:hypothetical protein
MTAVSSKFLHISGPAAVALAAHINGATSNADILSRSGFPGPVAIALCKMMSAGVADVGAIHRMGFSGSDATEIAAQITARGAH